MTPRTTTSKLRKCLLVIAAAGLVGPATIVAAVADPPEDTPGRGSKDRALQKSLDALVSEDKFPAAFAWVRKDGRTSSLVSGSARLGEQAPVPHDGYVRAGSNTNYPLAGLLTEKVTERPVQEQITERVIRKAGLRHTSWPQPGDRTLPVPHARGYALSSLENGKVVDATRMDPSWGGAAGQLISTPSELARFARLLLDGKLLAPGQLAEMRKTVDAPIMPGWRYGLGVLRAPLSCGGAYWGHGGDIDGYETRGGATDDCRSVGLAVTALPGTFSDAEKNAKAVMSATDTAFCN
ncbi:MULTISPECIES: serine hydrolase domain-containing protein [unclassified Streptomyces]|uniref:serine hydrolase domain-containing protein n=1 Tax=unclassified Streptomyces TaxID=2593676 RepID=UPI0024A87BD3|nr:MULTISPECIES: serine hydrolase domain-containing protein [unclassified Streptomyces]